MQTARRLVVGIGNPDRGDDAAGPEVVRHLEKAAPPGITLIRHAGDAAMLLEHLQNAKLAILIDASLSGAASGTIHRFDVVAGALPSALSRLSSHGFGLAQAIELARALGTLPRGCVIYAIEGERFLAGAPLTPSVARAAASVAERVLAELAGPAPDA